MGGFKIIFQAIEVFQNVLHLPYNTYFLQGVKAGLAVKLSAKLEWELGAAYSMT